MATSSLEVFPVSKGFLPL